MAVKMTTPLRTNSNTMRKKVAAEITADGAAGAEAAAAAEAAAGVASEADSEAALLVGAEDSAVSGIEDPGSEAEVASGAAAAAAAETAGPIGSNEDDSEAAGEAEVDPDAVEPVEPTSNIMELKATPKKLNKQQNNKKKRKQQYVKKTKIANLYGT
jgi:hypothetical protein